MVLLGVLLLVRIPIINPAEQGLDPLITLPVALCTQDVLGHAVGVLLLGFQDQEGVAVLVVALLCRVAALGRRSIVGVVGLLADLGPLQLDGAQMRSAGGLVIPQERTIEHKVTCLPASKVLAPLRQIAITEWPSTRPDLLRVGAGISSRASGFVRIGRQRAAGQVLAELERRSKVQGCV